MIHGSDCSIVIKTAYREMGVPYSEETVREAVSLLIEEAAIEGDGCCHVITKSGGVTGCVVTPLNLGAVPSCGIWLWETRGFRCMYPKPKIFTAIH
jgi:hypothetical protein